MAEAILKRRRELGQYLRLLRRSLGLTREQAAEKIGIHPVQLARVESASANFTISTLLAMSLAYGTPVEEIFAQKPLRKRKP